MGNEDLVTISYPDTDLSIDEQRFDELVDCDANIDCQGELNNQEIVAEVIERSC